MKDLYDYLQSFKEPHGNLLCKDYSLEELSSIIRGYEYALMRHNIKEFGTNFSRNFSFYLQRYHGGLPTHWVDFFTLEYHGVDRQQRYYNPCQAWNSFFELLEQYKKWLPYADK